MKHNGKTLFSLTLAALLTLSLTACGGGKNTTYANGGFTLSIPGKYAAQLTVETTADDADGLLFTVTEQASVEAAQAMGGDTEGAGWLFSIGGVSEAALHEMLCYDMSGREVFARDDEGNYFLYYHPTDVRLVRETDEEYTAAMEPWTALHEWASTVPDTFMKENTGLSSFTRGNSMLDMYLAQAAYLDGVNYTVSTTEFGPKSPNGVDATPYAERLMSGNGISYEDADIAEAPDGEYVVLNFPDDDVRFDFFLAESSENYVRTVWAGGNEELTKIVFPDDTAASSVMQDWYHALVEADDPMVGNWAERIAGRGLIEIAAAADETGKYDVNIHWGNGAAQMYYWHMTATKTGENELSYENAKNEVVTFDENGGESSEVKYENGTGKFLLQEGGELVWEDDVAQAGADTVFIRAD